MYRFLHVYKLNLNDRQAVGNWLVFNRTKTFLHHPRESSASDMFKANLYLSPTIRNSKTTNSQKHIIQSDPIRSHHILPPIRSQAQKRLPPWQVPVRPWPPSPYAQPASPAAPRTHSRCAHGKVSRSCLVP